MRISRRAAAALRRHGRGSVLALILVAGCRDSGLPHRNTPADQARLQAWRYPVYEVATPLTDAAAGVYTLGEQRFIATAAVEHVPERLLRPVGTAQGRQLFALSWDRSPFDRLYMVGPDGSVRVLLQGR